MIPTRGDCPPSHRYIGPVIWSPDMPLPDWWDSLSKDRPCVYVTLGSSGRSDLLPGVVEALGQLPLTAMVATAGRTQLEHVPDNVHVAELPARSRGCDSGPISLICSGGSATAFQALVPGCTRPRDRRQYGSVPDHERDLPGRGRASCCGRVMPIAPPFPER